MFFPTTNTKHITLVFLFFCLYCVATAQLNFKTKIIKLSDGLPSENINTIAEDSIGNLYLGTNRGVVQYDGYRFVPLNDGKKGIRYLLYKNNNFFCFSEQQGLITFKNIFDRPIVLHANNFFDADPDNDKYCQLYIDKQNRIWCNDFNKIKFFSLYEKDSGALEIDKNNRVDNKKIVFCEPTDKEVWAITYKGIFIYNNKLKSFDSSTDPILNKESYSAALLDSNNIYLGTSSSKIFVYHVRTHIIENLPSLPENQIAQQFKVLNINGKKTLLIASSNKLYVYENDVRKYQLIYNGGNAYIEDIHISNQLNIIWIATSKGLIKLSRPFNYLKINPLPEKKESVINAIIKDSIGNIWVGTKNALWKYKENKWLQYTFPLKNVICNSIFLYKQSPLVSTNQGIYQIRNSKLEKIKFAGKSPNNIKKSLVDHEGNFWIIPVDAPIRVYDIKTLKEKINYIINNDSICVDNEFNDILENNDHTIWFAAWFPKSYGIAFYDAKDKRIKSIADRNSHNRFMGDYYLGISKGTKNNDLLFCGGGGWNMVSNKGQITRLLNTDIYNISSNTIKHISQDDNNNIWFATDEGLNMYNIQTDRVIQINQRDGIPTSDLLHGYYQAKDNQLLLGIDDAVVHIDQDKILKTDFTNRLQLSAIRINGIIQPKIETLIKLEKEESDIELDFSTLNFSDDEKMVYRYHFSGDTKWTFLGYRPFISLIKLPAGQYSITIQAGDNLGNWQEKQLQVFLDIPTPYYKSLWFLCCIALLIALIIFLSVRYYFTQQKVKQQLNERIKDARLRALHAQMNPHFIFNVFNSIESYVVENDSKTASRLIQKFAALCRLILENSSLTIVNADREWQALKLYTEFEALRYSNQFRYDFEVAEELSLTSLLIPPMMIQPLIENAIHHGIRNSDKKDLFLNVKAFRSIQTLTFIIEDNGVGLDKGRKIEMNTRNNVVKQKSFGIAMIMERIDIINQTFGMEIASFTLVDNKETTVATITLPIYN